jgi:hypothetical protein
MKTRKQIFARLAMAATLLLGAEPANAVILVDHDFDADANGWTGSGDWTYTYNAVDDRLQGVFAEQVIGGPEFGYWSSGVLGDLTTSGTYDVTQMIFDFYAVNFVPSDVTVYVGSLELGFISRAVSGIVLGGNLGLTLDLSSSTGWGGSTASFSGILADVDYVEFEVSRGGVTNAQTFQLDNFQIEGVLAGAGGGGGPSAIPEPNVVNLLALVSLMALALRRSVRSKTANA